MSARTGVIRRLSSRPSPSFRALLGKAALAAALLAASASPSAGPATRIPVVTAGRGMVASAHPLASQAGLEMLKAGGNAVDAAVAAAFAVGVAEPQASGLGGEGMMVIYLAGSRRAIAVDYRSSAPASATYPGTIPASGYAAVAVPGTVAGLCRALERFGTLDLETILAPAIRIADEGFLVGPTLGGIILDDYEELVKEEDLARIYCPDGIPLAAGDILRNPDLAGSLRAIAAGGPEAFYSGELAEKIVSAAAARGGFLARDDLAGYRAIEREPVRGSYRGYDLISAPPPVGGLAVIEIMQILERFKAKRRDPLSEESVHILAEAMQRGMADWRAYVGDPGFVRVPVEGLLSKRYAKSRAAEIDPARVRPGIGPGEPEGRESPSTTSLAAVDGEGNMVALTQTISDFFGAKVVVPGTGIVLNNEMRNFSREGVNTLAPGKRMRTTIAPTIVLKGRNAFAALGTPGAARILTTMPILLSNLIDHRMDIQEAIESPRFFPAGAELAVESRFPEATVSALERMGYTVTVRTEYDLFFGGAQGIVIDPRTKKRIGGADPRRDGAVAGY